MSRSRLVAGAAAAAALFSAAVPAQAKDSAPMPRVQVEERTALDGFSVTSGIAYWQGDFGGATTSNLLVVPLTLRYEAGRLRIWGTLPYMRVESDGVLFAGTDGGPIIADPTTLSPFGPVREGLADLTIGATWSVIEEDENGLGFDLTTRVKLPTGEDELSTGKTDVGFAADVSQAFGNVVPFASVGYRFVGDTAEYDLKNTVRFSGGSSFLLGGDSVVLLSYDFEESTTRFVGDSHELLGALSGSLNDRFNWTGYGTVGLSEGASDFALGLLVSFAL